MKYKRRIAVVLSMLLLFMLTGCSKRVKNDTPVVVTVNDFNIHMDEMMYYIYQTEASGNANETMYQTFFGESYWETKDANGMTYRDLAKTDIMQQAIMNDIFYQRAKEAGYELSDNEKNKVLADTESIIEGWTDKQKHTMGIKKDRLLEIQTKVCLANKYYNDFLETLDVDEASAISAIYEEDYKEYDVEYLYVPTVTFKENNDVVPYSDKDKQTAYETTEEFLEKAKESTKLSDLLSEEEIEDGMEVSEVTFLKGDEIFGKEFETVALTLLNGEVANSIVEEEDGYYIIKMINNDSKVSYQDAMNRAVEDAKAEAFYEDYMNIKKEYKVKIQEHIWDSIEIGAITYDKNDAVKEGYFEDGIRFLDE